MFDTLNRNMARSLLCAGVDPDPRKVDGAHGKNAEDVIFNFLKEYLEAVSPHVCAFKVQKAFFDLHPAGHALLKETVAHIHQNHPNLPVILDCKIGDIGNTMAVYVENIFGNLGCDGVLVNPYMGDDIFDVLKDHPDKMVGVLCKTSNQGGSVLQDQILSTGDPLWMHALDLAMNRWNMAKNIFPVLSEVGDHTQLIRARQMIPEETPILFAGVGAQGRDESALRYLLNSSNSGVFVNSSRGLMYPSPREGQSLAAVQEEAATTLKERLESVRQTRAPLSSCFLFIGGVSGVGKTTLMHEMKKLDPRFCYIEPETTRPLRSGEKDKTSISVDELRRKENEGAYLAVNNLNGFLYGTPKQPIREAFNRGAFPMIDFPIDRHDVLKGVTNNRLYTVYLRPPSLSDLYNRLSQDGRDQSGERLASAQKELERYAKGDFSEIIDLDVVCESGKTPEIARKIYKGFISRALEK